MRVAVSQFATSLNAQENLASCIRMINEAAVCKPSVIVLPQYCNTQPWYTDHNQAWNEALTDDGEFLQAIAKHAKKHACYIVLGVTLRREQAKKEQRAPAQSEVKSNISITSCLFSPQGELIEQIDKQKLTEQESIFFSESSKTLDIITTAVGKVGLLAGNDDSSFKAARQLALTGVQLLCHSMSTFSLDQSSMHGPTRACENKVFLASANKIGQLLSDSQLKNQAYKDIPQEYLVGIGHSQIVSPEGKVLAMLANDDEGFIFADIDLTEININNKLRPDRTDIFKQRRPELYQNLKQRLTTSSTFIPEDKVPATANVAIFATYKSNEEAIEDVCHYIENNLSDIIQLPELFFIADKSLLNNPERLAQASDLSKQVIIQISSVLRPFQYVCTSLVIEDKHQAVIISEQGIFSTQQQLHFCQRYQWTTLSDELKIIELPLEQGNICLAILTADDANIAEMVNIAALANIHVLLIPFDIQEPCEVEYSLLARAAENRICIVAASREKSFATNLAVENISSNNPYGKNKVKTLKSTGLIANLTTNSALLSQWKPLKSTGYINKPLVKHQFGKITKAVIHPIAACTKLLS
jgi:predicted amidohydrolase